jgi:hypothetical protein
MPSSAIKEYNIRIPWIVPYCDAKFKWMISNCKILVQKENGQINFIPIYRKGKSWYPNAERI